MSSAVGLVLQHADGDARRGPAGRRSVRASSTMSRRPVCTASSTRRGCSSSPASPAGLAHVASSLASPRVPPVDGCGSRRPLRSTDVLPRGGVAPQPQEELDVAGRAGQRAGHDPGGAPAERGGGARPPRATAWTRCSGSRTTPPAPSRSRPTSNCGFTIGSRSASRSGAGGQRGQDQPQRDERQVGDDQVDRAVDRSGVRVRTLVRSSTRTRSSVRSDQASSP